mmetsp:Transcript_26222/g.71994  ORF Transcript_26222/g.71994 Transcript_26222/m.71994 type:complete len:151 (-) Transcript_26222:147-599(-)
MNERMNEFIDPFIDPFINPFIDPFVDPFIDSTRSQPTRVNERKGECLLPKDGHGPSECNEARRTMLDKIANASSLPPPRPHPNQGSFRCNRMDRMGGDDDDDDNDDDDDDSANRFLGFPLAVALFLIVEHSLLEWKSTRVNGSQRPPGSL